MEAPLVSVCVITYQHVNFIKTCLDGVLMQKASFNFEIIIGEDESNDGTREICLEYASKYPDKIQLFLRSRKDVIYINGTPTGRYNFLECIKSAQGKYIAICEGDDYWTDPYKLQKQINFLEENPEFAICFHNARIQNEDNSQIITYSNPVDQAEISSYEDLARGEFIYTTTCVFRREQFKKFPERFYLYINNYTIDLHNAQYGKIKYINEVMGVYRKHKGGIWSMVPREKTLMNQLPTYKFYLNYFEKKYQPYFKQHLKNITNELISIILAKKDYKNFWRYYKDYVYFNISDRNNIKRITYILLKANYDRLKQIVKGNG
jgi:glycosyltransferase involved in cell wall biosynthesis